MSDLIEMAEFSHMSLYSVCREMALAEIYEKYLPSHRYILEERRNNLIALFRSS